jgi:large subunit ribosomal protein L4
MEVPVLDKNGKEVGKISVDEAALGGEVNPALIKQAFVRYHANKRQGSARTKGRSDVAGSTRKLYKQKGTGNARVGNRRTGIRKGGGVIFAKRRKRGDFRQDMPIKMRRRANRNALLAKLLDNEVKVIDDLNFDKPATSTFRKMLSSISINRTCLVALDPSNMNAGLSARNLDRVSVCDSTSMTCFEMLNHRFLVISKGDLEAWINGPSSKTDKTVSRGQEVA